MFSKASVCLLVLMGLVMALGSPVQHVTNSLRHQHDIIAEALKLKDGTFAEIRVFRTIRNNTCQGRHSVQLMNATLKVYQRIFSSILNDSTGLLSEVDEKQKQDVIENLKKLQKETAEVEKDLDRPNKEQLMRELKDVQVRDTLIQKKALFHFLQIYNAAKNSAKCCSC